MAGPTFQAIGGFATSAGATSIAPAKPTVNSGPAGLLIAVVVSKNNATHSTATTGWTKINQTNSGASFTASVWVALQSAGAPTFTWTGSVACSAQIAYYQDVNDVMDATGASLLGTVGTGTTATHSSAGGNTTQRAALAIYVDACAANTAMATPSGWTEDNDAGSGTSTTRHVFGNKAIATSGSASGAISVTGGNAAWVQFQIQLIGIAPGSGLQASKVEVGAWEEPSSGYSVSKIEVGAWLGGADGLEISKVAVGAWLEPGTITPDPVLGGGRRMSLM